LGSRISLSSPNHGMYVVLRAKRDFKANATLDPNSEEVHEQLALARTLLDSLKLQKVSPDLGQHRAAKAEDAKIVDDFW
jgi:hypothetical protein